MSFLNFLKSLFCLAPEAFSKEEELEACSKLRKQANLKFEEAKKASKKEALKLRTEAKKLNLKASKRIYKLNNMKNSKNEIDLHFLYLDEAKHYLELKLKACKSKVKTLYVIVGKGNHSTNNIPKIKPMVENYLKENKYKFNINSKNEGIFIVHF